MRVRLAAAERALAAGRPSITVGGKRLWRTRNHLDAAGITEQQWRQRWDATRLFLTADGESGKAGGNETIRVDSHGRLRIKTPAALVSQLACGDRRPDTIRTPRPRVGRSGRSTAGDPLRPQL